MQGQSTVIRNPAIEGPASFKSFSYDYSYWSIDQSNPENYADQERVFKDLGINILENAFAGMSKQRFFVSVPPKSIHIMFLTSFFYILIGFNCSIFAYGQTGAGKSYSMLGYGEDKGTIDDRKFSGIFLNKGS